MLHLSEGMEQISIMMTIFDKALKNDILLLWLDLTEGHIRLAAHVGHEAMTNGNNYLS